MNERLNKIAECVPAGRGVIDVGTDHGYLLLQLAQSGYPGRLLAADINPGPLETARRHAEAVGLLDRLEFQLADGLELCDPEAVDCIVIAGMGGDTICGILDRAEWCMSPEYLLVLQPMTRAEVLRYWLVHNGFSISAEHLVRDGGALYSVFTARFGERERLTDAEYYTGAFHQIRTLPLCLPFLQQQLSRFEKICIGLRRAGKEPERLRFTERVTAQIREMIRNADSE